MNAVRIHEHGGTDVLVWEEITDPAIKPDQVLVQIKAAAINHLDIWVRRGIPGISLPMILGSDAAGIIKKVGQGVSDFIVGDAVIINPLLFCGKCETCIDGRENECPFIGIIGESTDGTNCEFIAVNERNLRKIPDNIDFESAASFPLAGQTAYQMLINRAQAKEDDTVLIWGSSSGVGSFGLQIAKAIGCNVIATGGSTAKCKQASDLGADISLNHYEDNILGAVKDFTNGNGVDVVFEHSGASTWDISMKILGRHGRVVTCGATTGSKVSIDLRYIFFKQQSILGSTMGNVQALDAVIELIKTDRIKPIVDEIFSMEKIADAHKYFENSNQFGKVVLIP
jgi:NADPH:quinone reductase-like Zn-dependent oxidoreductase